MEKQVKKYTGVDNLFAAIYLEAEYQSLRQAYKEDIGEEMPDCFQARAMYYNERTLIAEIKCIINELSSLFAPKQTFH